MRMNKLTAIEKIKFSLKTETSRIITPKGQTYEAHVEKISTLLMEAVIDPVRVKVTSSCVAEGDFDKFKYSVVWGIARKRDNWLLISKTDNEFALGFGSDPCNIMMHGFSSSDALGEWCA